MFEQDGVKNIRERKERNEDRHYQEKNKATDRLSSFEDIIDKARAKLTPEERVERFLSMKARLDKINKETTERNRCSECHVDTSKYSHTFKCSWRGMS